MRNFLKTSVPSLMAIVVVSGVGYLTLMPPESPAAQPSAPEIAVHSVHCGLCRLPLYGKEATPSKLGPEVSGSAGVEQSTR